MALLKQSIWSIEKLFSKILLLSLILHFTFALLLMNVEPPPPPSHDEYATFLKKIVPVKVEEKPPEVVKEEKPVEVEEEKVPEEVVAEKAPVRGAPTKGGGGGKGGGAKGAGVEGARRAAVRQKLSGAGLLASIGSTSEGGTLANVFESEGAVVSKELGTALAERGSVRVTGEARIGKKGAVGAETGSEIGGIDTGAGGSLGEAGGRAGASVQAFVKGGEPVLKKGGIDEKGVRLALRRRENGIRQCYERALKSNASLKGKVVLEWIINEQGKVVKVQVIQSTVGDSQVVDCIVDIISKIRFPAATQGIVPVRKTFVFESA